jgi:hypothetical protein
MSFLRPIQWYHSQVDPIWLDGTFYLQYVYFCADGVKMETNEIWIGVKRDVNKILSDFFANICECGGGGR